MTHLFKSASVISFVDAPDPVLALSGYNEFTFDGEEGAALAAMPETTEDVRLNLKDLKVLGKKDFKLLLKWRLQARRFLTKQVRSQQTRPRALRDNVQGLTVGHCVALLCGPPPPTPTPRGPLAQTDWSGHRHRRRQRDRQRRRPGRQNRVDRTHRR